MKTTLTNTEVFLESALVKGVIDSFDIVENGYNVAKGDKSLNIIVGVDSALIRDDNKLVEVKSSKLDNVLHRYIMSSLFGKKANDYFVMSSLNGDVVFTDINSKKWILNGAAPQSARAYFLQFVNNQAQDALIASSHLVEYKRGLNSSKVGDMETDIQLLVSDCNPDAYAVNPSPSLINSVGKTVVGNFVVSSADKKIVEEFNEEEISSDYDPDHINIDEYAEEFESEDDRNWRKGTSDEQLARRRKWEARNKRNVAESSAKISTKDSLSKLQSSADTVTVQLDNSQKLRISVGKDGIFSARFKVTPNVKVIEKALLNSGYAFCDIQNEMTLKADDPIVSSIINSAFEIEGVDEKATLKREVSKLSGNSVTSALRDYGIDDSMKVFSSIKRIVIE